MRRERASATDAEGCSIDKEVKTVERHRRLADEANPLGLTNAG
jgi:hypothetical protein